MRLATALGIAALALSAPCLSHAGIEPDALPPEAAQKLRDGWKRLADPSTGGPATAGIVVGFLKDGVVTPSGTAMEETIRNDLQAQLTDAGVKVLNDAIISKGLEMAQGALQRRAGDDAAKLTATLLRAHVKADVLFVVQLIAEADGSAARRFYNIYDTRPLPVEAIASENFDPRFINPAANLRARAEWLEDIRQGSTRVLIKLGNALATREPYVPLFRINVLGLEGDLFRKWRRELKSSRDLGLEVLNAPMEQGRETADAFLLQIKYSGEWLDLHDILADAANRATGLLMYTVFESGGLDAIVTLQESREPWAGLVGGKDGALPPERVGALLNTQRRPTVAIIIGPDVEGPVAEMTQEDRASTLPALGDEVAARTLGTHFASAGFEVKDAAAVRRQLEDEIARAGLAKNLSGMKAALRRTKSTDFLVLGRTDPIKGMLSLAVLDARGAQVAFIAYPDLRVRLYEKFVRTSDPDSVIRYLAGSLFLQLRTHAADSTMRSIEVVVKNTRNAQQVMELMAAFKGIDGVRSATDVRIDQPIGRFTVNTTHDTTALVAKAAELAAKKKFGPKSIVEVANENQIVLNLLPEWLSPSDDPLPPPQSAPATPEGAPSIVAGPSPSTPSVTPGDAASLTETLRSARDSIWVIGVENPHGRFFAVGTAWTVRDQLLATNAHVYDGIVEWQEQARKENVALRVVARNGANLDRSVEVDFAAAKKHPAYDRFNALQDRLVAEAGKSRDGLTMKVFSMIPAYDVAILPTRTSAGRPLRLATSDDLKAIGPLSPIGYAGYPSENRSGGGRSLQTLAGTVNALTNVFLQDVDDWKLRQLVHFSLPTAGGASGSPLIGPKGVVIGLLSAGDFVMADETRGERGNQVLARHRVPLGFTYGQRVDLLDDLIENKGTAVEIDRLEASWRAELDRVAQRL